MGRFFAGYQWRFLVTDLNSVPVTYLDRLATNRAVALALDQPSSIEGQVPSSDPRINTLHTDGAPLLGQNSRLLYAFRRDLTGGTGSSPKPWRPRAAGVVHNLQDQSTAGPAVTHFVAFDPWKYLEGRPVVDAAGTLAGQDGFTYFDQAGRIALQMLKDTIVNDGPVHIDAGTAWGGTAYYGGTIEATTSIAFNAAPGKMVGQAWTELVDAGQFDIVLTPIWDPARRPGYTHEVSIYNLAGANRPEAIFGWDKLNRAATGWDRMHDGTPGSFVNRVQYYVGQGGFPAPTQVNALSQAAYGRYWALQYFPEQNFADTVVGMARQALALGKQGKRTSTIDSQPENSPIALIDYGLGDRVQLYASENLRATAAGPQRVQAIPIKIDDDGVENVPGLLCSPDWRTGASF